MRDKVYTLECERCGKWKKKFEKNWLAAIARRAEGRREVLEGAGARLAELLKAAPAAEQP